MTLILWILLSATERQRQTGYKHNLEVANSRWACGVVQTICHVSSRLLMLTAISIVLLIVQRWYRAVYRSLTLPAVTKAATAAESVPGCGSAWWRHRRFPFVVAVIFPSDNNALLVGFLVEFRWGFIRRDHSVKRITRIFYYYDYIILIYY